MPAQLRIVVLGGPVPLALRARLADNLEVVDAQAASDGQAAAVLLYAHSDAIRALRRFREGGGTVPVFGYSSAPADIGARLEWIREGAEDLLDPASAPAALVRRIRGGGAREVAVDGDTPVAVRLDRYLLALDEYLARRRDLTRRLGDGGVASYLDTVVLRERVMRAGELLGGPVPPGERRGSPRELLVWQARLVDSPDEVVEVQNVSADGLGLSLDREPRQRSLLRVEVDGLAVSAQIELEIRWRRREGERWVAGAWATRATITRSA